MTKMNWLTTKSTMISTEQMTFFFSTKRRSAQRHRNKFWDLEMANDLNIQLLFMLLQIMDNILIQVNGRKRVVLFSPKDAVYLYLNGESDTGFRQNKTTKKSLTTVFFILILWSFQQCTVNDKTAS